MITAAWLRSLHACESQVALFERTFPDGAPLTAAAVQTARTAKLDLAWLARHPSAPADLLAVLAGDTDYYVRWAVAGNPSAAADLLAVLAGDSHWSVRWAVAARS